MLKSDLFIKAMNEELYRSKKWIISAFSVFKHESKEEPFQYQIIPSENFWLFYNKEINDYEPIIDSNGNHISCKEPLFDFSETIIIKGTDVINLNVPKLETTYGKLLANFILLIHCFSNKIEYINTTFKIGNIEKDISSKLVDKYSKEYNDLDKIKIEEYKEFVRAVGFIEGLTQLCVPTATEKSITTDPRIKEVVKELKEKYKGKLNDPLVIAKIDSIVEKMDRDWIKGDPSERFYLKDKSYAVSRKKMYGLYGGEAGLGDGSSMEFIDKPLSEGLDKDKLPDMINSLRSGSYDRGTQTALGGVAVKQFFRIFQNSNISQQDCGSTNGIFRPIREDNKKQFIDFYYISNKKSILITEDNIDSLVNTTIEMRSPATCKTPLTDFCEICMGVTNSRNKTGLGSSASEIGSKFMLLFLKSMHGKSLKISNLSVKTNII